MIFLFYFYTFLFSDQLWTQPDQDWRKYFKFKIQKFKIYYYGARFFIVVEKLLWNKSCWEAKPVTNAILVEVDLGHNVFFIIRK